MLNIVILFLAMTASGAIGFILARELYGRGGEQQLNALGNEVRRMRRRTRTAEAVAAKSTTERDRLRRSTRH